MIAIARASMAWVVLASTIVGCATGAPRAAPHSSTDNLRLAAENFRRVTSARVRLELPDGAVTADVRMPDAARIRSEHGEWIAVGARVWDAASKQPVDTPRPVAALQDALRLARSLDAGREARYEEGASADAYTAHVWSVTVDGRRIKVWLAARDDLPRRILLPDGVVYAFRDFDAEISVTQP